MSSQRVNLSLALIVKNEARCLTRCLRSVQNIVDEIVVIDTGSTDATVPLARQFNAKLSNFTWNDDFSAARNFALDQTAGEWVLVLDADESASENLAAEILDFTKGRHAVGRLRIVSEFRRYNQTLHSQSFVSRLFPRGARFEGHIHEQLISPLPRVNLQGELFHDGYLQPGKSERNVKLLLQEVEKSPSSSYILFQLALEYTSSNRTKEACDCLEKAFAFVQLHEPFAPNIIVDYLYALTELKRFESALAVIEKVSSVVEDFPDFHLACGLFYMNLVRSNTGKYISYLTNIEASFKRCLALGESDKYKSVRGSGTFLAQYNLGTLYQVFGDVAGARRCFEQAASVGYEPAQQALQRLKS
jgi:glycosyltransferase involved in cell wall biosynthesis